MPRSDLAELLARDKADSKAKFGKWKWQVPQVIKCHRISFNACKIDAWTWGFKGYLWIWFDRLWIISAWTSETTLSSSWSFVHPWQLLAPQSATEFVEAVRLDWVRWTVHNERRWWTEKRLNDACFLPISNSAARSSRHSRFGTSMQTVSADGTLNAWILERNKNVKKKSYCPYEREYINVTCKRFQHPWCKRASFRRAVRVKLKLEVFWTVATDIYI